MKNWLIGSVAALALLGACGGKDEGAASSAAGTEVTVGDIKIDALKLRGGDASKAGDALAAMSLTSSGEGQVSFADKSASGADATFNDVSINLGSETPVTAGALIFKGLDMTNDGASFSQMTLSNISVATPDEEGMLTVGSVQLTNPSPALAAWVADMVNGGGEVPFPTLDKLSFDGLSMDGFSFPTEGIEELNALELGKINIRELSSEKVGAFIFEGLNVDGEDDGQPIKMSLESMAITGLTEDFMKLFAAGFAAGASGGDPEDILEEISKFGPTNFGDPGYDQFNLDNFVVDAAGLGIDLPSVDAVVTRDKQGRATRAVTNPFKFSVSADPEGELGAQMAGPLAIMGYETLNFSGASDSRMDPDADMISADSAANWFALEDGFKLSLGMSATGLSEFYSKLAEDPENEQQALVALGELSMNSIDLTFEDNSIMEKAFTLAGALSDQDAAALKSQAVASVAFLPLAAGQAGVDAALAAELGGALSSFLNNSGTLSISLNPAEAVTAADFQDPTKLTKDRLGFSAKAE